MGIYRIFGREMVEYREAEYREGPTPKRILGQDELIYLTGWNIPA